MGVLRLLSWEASQLLTGRNGPVAMVTAEPGSGPRPPRAVSTDAPPPQYSQCSQAIPRGMVVRCVPQRAEAVSPAVCLSTKAQVGPTWPRVSEGGPRLGKGWPQSSSPAGGRQVLLGQCPPLSAWPSGGQPGGGSCKSHGSRDLA